MTLSKCATGMPTTCHFQPEHPIIIWLIATAQQLQSAPFAIRQHYQTFEFTCGASDDLNCLVSVLHVVLSIIAEPETCVGKAGCMHLTTNGLLLLALTAGSHCCCCLTLLPLAAAATHITAAASHCCCYLSLPLPLAASRCLSLPLTASHCLSLPLAASHCLTLPHTASHCLTLLLARCGGLHSIGE